MKFSGSANDGGSTSVARDSAEINETTRLLPERQSAGPIQHDDGTPYLSADDPAVSPYNLFSVRATRYFTLLLLAITGVWWILVLVSQFVTLPGFETRGSPFFAFAYTSLALAVLSVSLVFFTAPSRLVRGITAGVAVLLLVNTILLAAVNRTRLEEGWVGISSVVAALVVTVWTIVADRTVQWGKTEEEERLTGRPETRRTFFEWMQVTLSSLVLLALLAASFLLTCSVILRALDAGLAPPGKRYLVDGNKYAVHVYCHGSKTQAPLPTVLIEGGEAPVELGLWQFADAAVKNGTITRYCFADRPGLAWSDTAPSPFSAGMAADALSEALAAAGEAGPWVLLGAGVGSLYTRVFSSRHGAEIKGLLLVDPLHEDLLPSRLGTRSRGFWLWLRGVFSPLGLDRVPGALFRGRNKEDRVWGRAASQGSKTIFARLQESLVAGSLTRRDVAASRAIQFQDTALAVVSSGEQIKRNADWESKQRDLTHLTHNLVAWDVVDAPHAVWMNLDGRAAMEKRLGRLVRKKKGVKETDTVHAE